MKSCCIAVDGPAGAGKSTICKLVAKELNIEYIDTGAMYRAMTLKLMNQGVDLDKIDEAKDIIDNTSIDFVYNSIFLDCNNVDQLIRVPEINKNVSKVASNAYVREKLVTLQRQMSREKSIVMDGRDISSNVLPHADYKFYLTASVERRAERRYREMLEKGYKVDIEDIKADIEKRDKNDMERELNPLRKNKDAIEIDSSFMTIDEVVQKIISYIK